MGFEIGDLVARVRSSFAGRRPRILVLGDFMVDRYVWGGCQRISPEAPVQVVEVTERGTALGGAGNVAANLRALGAEVVAATVLGDGAVRSELEELLGKVVDDAVIVTAPGRPITEKTRVVAARQQVVRFDVETREAIDETTAGQLVDELARVLDDIDQIVVSDYGKGVVVAPLVQGLIARARPKNVPVLCDPKGADWSKYAGATVVTPNRREAAEAAGEDLAREDALRRAGERLRSHHRLDNLLVTLSEQGMALFEGERFHHFPTVAREVFDVTGAGDTVIAALALGSAAGLTLPEACAFANAAAGVAVGHLGAAAVTLDEVDASVHVRRGFRSKLKTRSELVEVCEAARRRGLRIVFTNGCFDILHLGHVTLLERAASFGDVLILGLNTDASVARLKPGRPINPEGDRAAVVGALASVDYVTLFDEDTPLELVRAIAPDVIVKGGDYEPRDVVGADVVAARGGDVRIVPLVEGRSTSQVVDKMRTDG